MNSNFTLVEIATLVFDRVILTLDLLNWLNPKTPIILRALMGYSLIIDIRRSNKLLLSLYRLHSLRISMDQLRINRPTTLLWLFLHFWNFIHKHSLRDLFNLLVLFSNCLNRVYLELCANIRIPSNRKVFIIHSLVFSSNWIIIISDDVCSYIIRRLQVKGSHFVLHLVKSFRLNL